MYARPYFPSRATHTDDDDPRCRCRATTSMKSAASDRRKKEVEYRKKMMAEMASRKNVAAVRRLTQEELLEEAKETEKQVSRVDETTLGYSRATLDYSR